MKHLIEKRVLVDQLTIEQRAEGDERPPVIAGHAAVFDQLSVDLGGFREKIDRGAFSKAIGGDVRALFNHDPNIVLGRTRAKTLRLAEDQTGLRVEIDPPDTESARSLIESIRRRDINQMSFAFRTIEDEFERKGDGEIIRTLKEVELFDVSPVTYPAYPQTDVAVRALESWQAENEEQHEDAEARQMETRRAQVRQRQAEAEL